MRKTTAIFRTFYQAYPIIGMRLAFERATEAIQKARDRRAARIVKKHRLDGNDGIADFCDAMASEILGKKGAKR